MKVLKKLWGLLVDDGRLATILVVALVVAYVISASGQHIIGAIVIWLGLIIALWVSVDHQLRVKVKKR